MNIRFKNSFKWFIFALSLAVMLVPAMTMAQQAPPAPGGTDLFLLDKDDLSRKTFIEPLFGPLVGSSTESPLTALMFTFNSALLVVGGVLMAYTIVAGTMSTAHDGEMLGKKWSSMWLPIRTALGVGMVLPVVGGGWCVAQAVVVWLAMQGAGLANVLWSSFIGPDLNSVAASASYTPPMSLSAIRETYGLMIVNSTCVAAFQKDRHNSGKDADLFNAPSHGISVSPGIDAVPSKDSNVLKISYAQEGGLISAAMGASDRCGQIVLEEDIGEEESSSSNTASSEALRMADITGPIAEARWKEFHKANAKFAKVGLSIANNTPSEPYKSLQEEVDTTIDELLKSYSENVGAAAKEAFKGGVRGDFVDKIKQDGWIMAGAFYMQIAKTQDLVTRSVTNAPATSSVNTMGNVDNMVGEGLNQWLFGSSEITAATNLAQDIVAKSSESSGSLAAIGSTSVSNSSQSSGYWQSKVLNWFMNKDETGLFSGGRSGVADVNENPIIMAKGLGEKMTTTAWAAFLAFVGFTGAGAGGLGSSVAPIFATLFLSLLIPGATLSTYLPLLPYILWIGVVLGWAILLIEAVVAAPLWAIVHLAPDGDGVVGRGGQGYMLVLSLILRPPLMIVGLVAAFVLMKPVGFLINSTFLGAFNIGVSPGTAGLTQAFAACIIYAVLMVITVQRVFSLIHVIPDRLLRWIGGGSGGELGQEAQSMDQGTANKMTAGLSIGANQIGNSMTSAATNAQRDRLAKKDRDASEAKHAALSQAQAVESAGSNYTDKDQDANVASVRAEAARANGGDEGLESGAAVSHDKAARAAETSAEKQAQKDDTPDAKDFTAGLSNARNAEAAGHTNAVSEFMNQQTAKAQAGAASGAGLRPFQESLLSRASHQDQAAAHRAEGGSIKQAKAEAGAKQAQIAGFKAAAESSTGEARQQAKAAVQQASGSSHPDAKAFTQSLDEARASGAPGAKTAAVQAATDRAYEVKNSGGTLEPFQQSLINRDGYNQEAARHTQAAEAIENPPAQNNMIEDPFADNGDDGLPPKGSR